MQSSNVTITITSRGVCRSFSVRGGLAGALAWFSPDFTPRAHMAPPPLAYSYRPTARPLVLMTPRGV